MLTEKWKYGNKGIKSMDKKKIRQYRLHHKLKYSRYPLSISQLCESLETSDKTLYRDIQELRDQYLAPVILQDGLLSYDKNSRDSFELPGVWFSDDELQALLAVQQLLSQIQPGLLDEQITPLKQLIIGMLSQHGRPPQQSLKRIRILGIGQRNSQTRHFKKIAGVVLDRKQCRLEYINRKSGDVSERVISPQRLAYYRDNWYLDAWCHLKNALRTFSMDNIRAITPLEEATRDCSEEQLSEHFESAFGIFSGTADKVAILQFSGIQARYLEKEQWHPQQQGEWQQDRYILKIPYANPTELIMDILKYGADVEVLEPEELRQAVSEKISEMQRIYKK